MPATDEQGAPDHLRSGWTQPPCPCTLSSMRSSRAVGVWVFALAAVPRFLHLAFAPMRLDDWQWGLASSLLTRRVLEHEGATTDFEPLYSLFVAGIRFVAGDRPVV